MKDMREALTWVEKCAKGMSEELHLDDRDIAYVFLQAGTKHYLSSLGKDYLKEEIHQEDN